MPSLLVFMAALATVALGVFRTVVGKLLSVHAAGEGTISGKIARVRNVPAAK